MSEMKNHKTWVGLGIKVGGMLFVGMDTFEGSVWRLDDPQHSTKVNVTNLRLGIGGGGQIGLRLFSSLTRTRFTE